MMKLVRLLYVMFMIIGLIRCDMNRMEVNKQELQEIDQKNKEGNEKSDKDSDSGSSSGSSCPNPFKLNEMEVTLTDTKRVDGQGDESIEYHTIRLTTATDLDPQNVACKYQMYCATVQAQAYEGFLGSKKKFTNLENKVNKERQEYIDSVNKQKKAEQNLAKERNVRIGRRMKKKFFFAVLAIAAFVCLLACRKGPTPAEIRERKRKERERKLRAAQKEKDRRVRDAQKKLDDRKDATEKEKKEFMEAQESLIIKKGTCGTCPGDFEFNLRITPMTQVLKTKEDKTQYLVNEVELYREPFDGKFDSDMTKESPIISRIECYVSFEKAGMVLAGSQYGEEAFGTSMDLFRNSYLVTLGNDYKVIFDIEYDGTKGFLPELSKLDYDLQSEGCLNDCALVPEASMQFNEQEICEVETQEKSLESIRDFETQFNNKYLANIKNFVQSIQTIYSINDLCVKIIKLIKFAEFRNDEYTNFAVAGGLADYYNGKDLNVNELGIYGGFKNDFLFTFVTFDRQCMINKMFGRSMFQ